MWEFNYFTGNVSLRSTYLPSHKFNYPGHSYPLVQWQTQGSESFARAQIKFFVPPVGLEPTLEGF